MKKAILLDSTLAKAYNTLGVIYKNTERYAEAEAAAQKAVGLDSTYANAYNTIGSVCLLTRRYAEAEVAFSKAIGFDSTSWIFPANLGLLYHDLRRWEACANNMRKAIELGPPIVGLTAALANAYTHLPARFAEARLLLDKALDMDPDFPDTHIHLAQWMLINRQPAEAWQALEKGIEKGIENGNLTFDHLQTEPDFETFRQELRWNELMKKHFPDKVKD